VPRRASANELRELAQHIVDLLENSAGAGARRVEIELEMDSSADSVRLTVTDDGCGMTPDVVARVTDPFYTSRTCRKVGLGLPLMAASSQRSGGGLRIESAPGRGTKVEASFQLSHIDTPPLGDLQSTLICAIEGHPDVDLLYRQVMDGRVFELDSGAIKRELGEVPLSHPSVLRWLEEYISEGLAGAVTAPEEDANA
jgi:anti-sigma regulatory factor (Ser/Thr protein kinase)